jgi:GT2 family glycosyltransferase
MRKEFVNIGILSFNRLNYTRQCIEAIHTTKGSYPFKITVIEQGSTDGSAEYLKDLKSKNLIDNLCLNPKNVGVARGANAAWTREPDAKYFLKLDNDMVAKKVGWLDDMIGVYSIMPKFGTLGYNVEPVSYPVNVDMGKYKLRLKSANIGGACLLIPEYVESVIGYFDENSFGLYGEEDASYAIRLSMRGLRNAYMEDENAFFHLPAGKAAAIDITNGYKASDGVEEVNETEYRTFKDQFREKNVPKLFDNVEKYKQDIRLTYCNSSTAKDFRFRWVKDK